MTNEEIIRWFIDSPFYHKDHEPFNKAIKALEQPEIIRCEECRHYRTCEIFGKKITLCKRREYDALSVEPDDFCSYAERKKENDVV